MHNGPANSRPVCFIFERARPSRQFLLGKGHQDEEIVHFYRGTKAKIGGMEAIAFVASVKYQACSNLNNTP